MQFFGSSTRLWHFPHSLSRVQTSCVLKASSLLCVLHRRVSPADVVIFFASTSQGSKDARLSDVSTLSFPLQSRRIRSRSCEDRSPGWTQSSCRADRSFWFNINLPPMQQLLTLMLCLCSCTRAEKGRKLLPCAFVLEQRGQNGIKTRFLTLLSCISGLELLP